MAFKNVAANDKTNPNKALHLLYQLKCTCLRLLLPPFPPPLPPPPSRHSSNTKHVKLTAQKQIKKQPDTMGNNRSKSPTKITNWVKNQVKTIARTGSFAKKKKSGVCMREHPQPLTRSSIFLASPSMKRQ